MPIPIGATAINPQTGHKIVLTEKGWVALNTPQMALPQADEKSMEALQADVQQKQYLDQKARQFMGDMDPVSATPGHPARGGFATGPALTPSFNIPGTEIGVPNPIHALVNARDDRLGALESVANQSFVHLRPPGSGPIRGYEAGPFKQAFPNTTNYGPANERIADQIHQDAQLATQKLAFIDGFIRSGQGDYAAANAAWQQATGNNATPQAPQQPPAIPPPMAMVPDPQSPIGAVPAPGVAPPPPQQQTPQQTAILNWTPDKGLHP